MEWSAVADEWGTAMIEMEDKMPRLVEFDLRLEDGGWRNDGVCYETEEVYEMFLHRRQQADGAMVSIQADVDVMAGALLPILLACQRTGVEFILVIGDDQNHGRKVRTLHQHLAGAGIAPYPSLRRQSRLEISLPNISSPLWFQHPWFPEPFQMNHPMGTGGGFGRGSGSGTWSGGCG